MRIQVLQHGTCVWVGSMLSWFDQQHYCLQPSFLDKGDVLPSINDFDWLVVMGGGMSVLQEADYPWMLQEKQLIKEAIAADKKILGICLGAQLIASALGARLYRNHTEEIGWHSIIKTHEVASWLPNSVKLLSWHEDCFDAPESAIAFARSEQTPCQGFCIGNKVWALQFHLEAKCGAVEHFLASAGGYLPTGPAVQSLAQMNANSDFSQSQQIMENLLTVIDKAH